MYEISCIRYNEKLRIKFLGEKGSKNSENKIPLKELYFYNAENFSEIFNILNNNQAFFYFLHFHYFFLIFLYSILKLSIINPGRNSKEYHDIYNIRNYFNFYYLYCQKDDKESLNVYPIDDNNNPNEKENLLSNLNKFIDYKMKQNLNNNFNTEHSYLESITSKTPKFSETNININFNNNNISSNKNNENFINKEEIILDFNTANSNHENNNNMNFNLNDNQKFSSNK